MTECITLPQTQFHLILEGDVKKALVVVPDNSVDLVMTSPPYWGMRFYGEAANTQWDDWFGQLGLEPKYEMYVKHLVGIFHEVKRILKPTGSIYLNISDTYSGSMQGYGATHKSPHGFQDVNDGYFASSVGLPPMAKTDLPRKSMIGVPWRVALAMMDDEWILRNDIIWYKINHLPNPVDDRLTNSYEHIFFFTKEPDYYYDLDSIRISHASVPQPIVAAPSLDGMATESKYKNIDAFEAGNGKSASANRTTVRIVSREMAKEIFPNDEKKQQEYINFIHDHQSHPLGKNPGDMWEINTKPYKDAHFATFPEEVCITPIKASCPKEVCKKCGKPKIHKVETKIADMQDLPKGQQEAIQRAGSMDGFYEGEATKDYKEANAQNPSDAKRSILESMRKVVVGDSWVATCNCNEGFKEGVVLDIFAGSGTTASVAKSLNRSSISIEINPEYIPLIKNRLDFNQTTLDNIIRYYEKIE